MNVTHFFRQVAKIARFCTTLRERLQFRGRGCDKAGSQKGTVNGVISDNMVDIRCVADLKQLAVSSTPAPVLARLVREAGQRLATRKLVPLSSVLAEDQIEAGIALVRPHRTSSNQELWKVLVSNQQEGKSKTFSDFVTRLWLLSPQESVVESMASMIGEVLGEHRQLNHENAAEELAIRWNGPSLCRADHLISSVRRRLSASNTFRCTRRTPISQAFEGTVISRHKRASDAKACLWNV